MRFLPTHKLIFVPILVAACLMQACRESNPPKPPITIQAMWDCHQSANLDSTALRNALVGQWEWEYVSCFWTPDQATNTSSEGLTITFDPEANLAVKIDGSLQETATWRLIPAGSNLWELATNPQISYLYGHILLCDDRVLFNHSYIDGCDNYFQRQ